MEAGCASSSSPPPPVGYDVRLQGADAPVSRHDTEDEAEAAAAAYRRGAEDNRAGELVTLRDGAEVLILQIKAEDKPRCSWPAGSGSGASPATCASWAPSRA